MKRPRASRMMDFKGVLFGSISEMKRKFGGCDYGFRYLGIDKLRVGFKTASFFAGLLGNDTYINLILNADA